MLSLHQKSASLLLLSFFISACSTSSPETYNHKTSGINDSFTEYQASIPSSSTASPEMPKTREAVARIDIAPPLSVNKSPITKKGTRAFFGDKENNSIIVVDVEKMEHIREISTGHLMTYTTDKIGNGLKAYTVNRGSNAIDVVDTRNMKITKTIKLEHTPRSAEAINPTLQLCAVSGMDKGMVSIISAKTDTVVAVVGDRAITQPVNNHGSHATGHPFWLDAHHFILIDRKKKKIFTYHIQQKGDGSWQTTLLNGVDTLASAHQIIPRKKRYFGDNDKFYLTIEGSDTQLPLIMELQLIQGIGLVKTREVTIAVEGADPLKTHIHHGDFHPHKPLIYVGSKEGNFFILNYKTMKIVKTFKAGKGAGHTMMVPQKNLAIIINHNDLFITIVDTKTDTKIKDLVVSGVYEDLVGVKTIQAHPKYHTSKDGKYFYAFLTEEGAFYKVDLDKLELVERLLVGGKPAQGSFIHY